MSDTPDKPDPAAPSHEHESVAHEVEDYFSGDIEIEREALHDSVAHDYSTSATGLVPLDKRRPIGHFVALWTTFAAGYSFLFVGTEVHDSGFSLLGTVGVTALGVGIYFAYAIFGAYLGSRTGQTMTLLTRSIFGITGSYIVSALVVLGALGWVGFQGGLMVQIWDGLYSWGAVEALTIIFCGLMIFNNLFGFTGISTFARYVVTPLIILWILYLVIKGFISPPASLSAHPKNVSGLAFWQVVGVVIGFAMWGNEPDVWRYGKPKFTWPIPAFAFALGVGFLLFTVGGWMMAAFARSTDFGVVVRYATALLAVRRPLAVVVPGHDQPVRDQRRQLLRGGQRVPEHHRRLEQVEAAVHVLRVRCGRRARRLPGQLRDHQRVPQGRRVPRRDGAVRDDDHVSSTTSLLPRLFGISRPLLKIPRWGDTSVGNWPAIVALAISVLFGAWATGIVPGENPNRYWGPGPLEAWAMAAVLYVVFVAITRVVVPKALPLKQMLGFSALVIDEPLPSHAIVDIATQAEQKAQQAAPLKPSLATADGS